MREKKIMGLLYFGILEQICAVRPNMKRKSNRIFNADEEKYALVRIASIVVKLD